MGYEFIYYEGNNPKPKVFMVHAIMFQSTSCPRKYMIVGVKPEFDMTQDIEDNDGDTYDDWDFNSDTYTCFHSYYDDFDKIDNITVYEKGGVCNSEDKDDGEDG